MDRYLIRRGTGYAFRIAVKSLPTATPFRVQ